jgi:hypothetical protein
MPKTILESICNILVFGMSIGLEILFMAYDDTDTDKEFVGSIGY